MRSRSFHPVMTLITFMLMLFGLASGCVSEPTGTSVITSNPIEEVDIATTTDTAIAQSDQATQNQIDQGIRFDSWVEAMTPFVTENSNWTYTFDDPNFLASIVSTHPEVVAYYEGSGSATDDTVVIDVLIAGFDIVNPYALEQYNELTANGTIAPPPSTWRTWYWWGYKQCFTGGDANTAEGQICYGAIVTTIGFAIPGAYLSGCCYAADSCNDAYGQFCVKWTWTLNWVWISCS